MDSLTDQLTRLAERGPVADPRFVVRRAIHDAAQPDETGLWTGTSARVAVRPFTLRERLAPTRPRGRWLAAATAVIVIAAGVAGVAVVRWRAEGPAVGTVPPAAVDSPSAVPVEPPSASLLDTAVPGDVQPLFALDLPGWRLDSFTGFRPDVVVEPSAECPGCGTWRLVVAEGGDLFSGGLFTAWTVAGAVGALDGLPTPVTVGDFQGGSVTSPSGTPAEQSWATLAWPLGDGPGALVAVVDARGIPYEQVVEMAAGLTFESWIPAIPELPAGFEVIDQPEPGDAQHAYLAFSNGYDVVNVYVTNRGVQGLLDWRYIVVGDLIAGEWAPRKIGDTTVGFSWSDDDEVAWGNAMWVAGDWAYTVDGVRLDADEFAEALASLHLTDAATFTEAESAAATGILDLPERETSGWGTDWRERRFGQ